MDPTLNSEEKALNENYKRHELFERIKYYLQQIEPVVVKILNVTIYYTLRFIKVAVSSVFKMILGKEV